MRRSENVTVHVKIDETPKKKEGGHLSIQNTALSSHLFTSNLSEDKATTYDKTIYLSRLNQILFNTRIKVYNGHLISATLGSLDFFLTFF